MKKSVFFILAVIILNCPIYSLAKRIAVDYPDEVIVDGIKYGATYSEHLFSYEAYIEARDVKSDEVMWKKKIYSIFLSPLKEHDIQFVMIKKVSYENGSLVVVNEKDDRYLVNLETLEIRKDSTNPLPEDRQ